MIAPNPRLTLFAGSLALLGACSSISYAEDADQEVDAILQEGIAETLGAREQTVLQPEIEPPPQPQPKDESPLKEPPVVPEAPRPAAKLTLADALATAVSLNREFLSQRESLYRAGLSLSATRFDFGPQFRQAMTYLWGNDEDGTGSQRAGTTFAADQILPTGGRIGLTAGLDATWPYGGPGVDDPVYGTNAGIALSQPLLRGAGYDIAWEPLTQAERSFVYEIRRFEEFRQGFTIGIARQFFALLSQQKTLANQDTDYEAAVFDRRKAEALQQVDRNTEKDVILARRREVEAKDQLINARANYDRAVDSYKIQLGLPTTTNIDLVPTDPPYEPVRFEVGSAIAAARANRLDLITQRQGVEDTERSLRIAENSLLPDLNLAATFGSGGIGTNLGHAPPDEWNSSVGLTFEVPWQQKSERNSYRSALISLEQARRNLRLAEDQLDLDIRDAIRQLHSIEERIALQQESIVQERRAVTVMEIRYEAGDVENRELLEARQAFVNAQNALLGLMVDHFVARLNLLKDMGIFFVDDKGMWR